MTSQHPDPWYLIGNNDQLDSPALILYPQRIAKNIAILKDTIDNVNRLRPHVKTHKNVEITRMMLEAGISKFKCATIAEAEMLGLCKAPDVLLAYQPTGPKTERFMELISRYTDTSYSCLVDNIFSAKELNAAAEQHHMHIRIFLDLNVGMNRTGITPGDAAFDLYKAINALPEIHLCGLHAYDGHIHEASIDHRKAHWQQTIEQIDILRRQIITAGFAEPVVVAGGTPTYPFYAQFTDFECSPGTFVLWDKGYQDAFTEQPYLPAALLISRIISITGEGRATTDLGHKSVSAENELSRRIYFLNAPDAVMIGQSEEHLVIEPHTDLALKVGDVLYGLPIHICPTVALYSTASLVENHQLKGEWNIISRERKINI